MTWPTRTTAIPSGLASSIRRSAAPRTWPTLPAGPSSSSTVAVWTESTTRSAGRLAPGDLGDPVDRRLGQDRGSPAGRPVEEPETLGAEADLGGRLLAGRVEDAQRTGSPAIPAAAWRRSVDLPIPGSPPTQHERARDEPASEDPVQLGDPDGEARLLGLADVGEADRALRRLRRRLRARPTRRGPPAASSGPVSRRGCSRPSRRGTGPPSGGTIRRRTGRRSASAVGRGLLMPGGPERSTVRLRPVSGARRRGCRGRPPGRGQPRSSCPARTCRAAGARPGRPRPCSGSPGEADGRRTPRRSRA